MKITKQYLQKLQYILKKGYFIAILCSKNITLGSNKHIHEK